MKATRRGKDGTCAGLTSRASLTRHSDLAFQEMLNAVQATIERIERLEAALIEIVPDWTMAPVVAASRQCAGCGL